MQRLRRRARRLRSLACARRAFFRRRRSRLIQPSPAHFPVATLFVDRRIARARYRAMFAPIARCASGPDARHALQAIAPRRAPATPTPVRRKMRRRLRVRCSPTSARAQASMDHVKRRYPSRKTSCSCACIGKRRAKGANGAFARRSCLSALNVFASEEKSACRIFRRRRYLPGARRLVRPLQFFACKKSVSITTMTESAILQGYLRPAAADRAIGAGSILPARQLFPAVRSAS